jgi:DNA-binding transcriptional ArsR family regulator
MLDVTLLALSDSTRRSILAQLARGEATVNELAAPFPISQPAISQHIKVLENAGLILRRIDGTRRPCRLAPEGLAGLEDWLTQLRRVYETNYARLDMLLDEMQTEEKDT